MKKFLTDVVLSVLARRASDKRDSAKDNSAKDTCITVFFEADDFLPLLTDGADDGWRAGGAEVQQSYLARGFALDDRFRAVLAGSDPRPATLDEKFEYIQIPGHITRGLPLIGRLINLMRSQATFKEVSLPAVFLQTQFERLDLSYAAQAAGVKIVRWINGDSIVEPDSAIDEVSRMHITRRLDAADALVAQSVYQQELIEKFLKRPSTVIGSMLPDMPQAQDATSRFESRSVLWVGRNHQTKNPEGLLDLAELMPTVDFIFVAAPSDASPEYQDTIAKRAQALPNVIYHPGLPLEETQRLYGNVSMCVNTSHTEGMPNTLIEASVVGIPTGALYVNPENLLVEDNGCFSAGGDMKALVEWIQETLDDIRLYEKRCKQVRELALHQWDNQKVIDDYWRIFKSVMLRHP